jgi:DNA-binding transcriptional LysR family regulator
MVEVAPSIKRENFNTVISCSNHGGAAMTPQVRSLTIRQLEMFATIARERSFRRAADVLTVSESAISQQLKVLEWTAGAKLLERSHRAPVRLTEAGRRLLSTTEDVIRQLADALGELGALHRAEEGHVAFGAGRAFGVHLLPVLYATFHEAHPGITVRAEGGPNAKLLEGLLERRLDMALVHGTVDEPELSTSQFGRVDQVLIGPPHHRLGSGPASPFEALASERLVPPAAGTAVRAALDSKAAEHGVKLEVTWEVESVEAQMNAVASGVGIGLVPFFAARPHLTAGTITLLHVDGFPMRFHWYLVWRAGQESAPVHAFKEHLLGHRKDLEALSLSRTGYPDSTVPVPRVPRFKREIADPFKVPGSLG